MEYREIGYEPGFWMRLIFVACGLIVLVSQFRGKNAISARWTFAGSVFAAAFPLMSVGLVGFYACMFTGGIIQMRREKTSRLAFWGLSALCAITFAFYFYASIIGPQPSKLLILQKDQLVSTNASPYRKAPRSKVQVTAVAEQGEMPTSWFISGDGMPKPGRSMRWLGTSYWYWTSDGRLLRGDKVAQEVADWADVEIGRETWEEARSP